MSRKSRREISFAQQDPALALASLFRPVMRGRRPGGLTVHTQFDGVKLTWMLWKALDSRDQSVLLAAVGMAGLDPDCTISQEAPGSFGQQLWLDLEPTENAEFDRAVVVTTSRWALIQASDIDDNSRNTKKEGLLEACLDRLAMVGVRAEDERGYKWHMKLLSWVEAPDGRIHIALNSRFAEAFGGQHIRVSLEERRQFRGLDKEKAQVAHAWLSAWMRPGETRTIRVDVIAEKIWGPQKPNESSTRSRRGRARQALEMIGQLEGWNMQFEGRGVELRATIKRPSIIEHEPKRLKPRATAADGPGSDRPRTNNRSNGDV